jgi:hypothetical protein
MLSERDEFFVGERRIELIHCENVGRQTARAVFRVYSDEGHLDKEVSCGEIVELLPTVAVEIWKKGNFKKNRLQIIVSAPDTVIIQRPGFDMSKRNIRS